MSNETELAKLCAAVEQLKDGGDRERIIQIENNSIKNNEDIKSIKKDIGSLKKSFDDFCLRIHNVIDSNYKDGVNKLMIRPTWAVLIPVFIVCLSIFYNVYDNMHTQEIRIETKLNDFDSRLTQQEYMLDKSLENIYNELKKLRIGK